MAQVYISQLDAFDLYHLHHLSPRAKSTTSGALPAFGDALAGCIGAAISNVFTYPLALVVTRLQIQRLKRHSDHGVGNTVTKDEDPERRKDGNSFSDAIGKILDQDGGLKGFWNGVEADTLKTILDAFLFFYAYNFFRRRRLKQMNRSKHLPVLDELGVGFLAGAFSKLLTTPLANVVTRKQTHLGKSVSTKTIAAEIYNERGYDGFWAGYTASLILTLNPSLTFFLFESLKRALLPKGKRGEHMDAKITFLLAAMSKAAASSVTYPFSLAKARLQASSSSRNKAARKGSQKTPLGDRNDTSNTVFGTVGQILRTEGFGALYEGLGGEVTKGFFSHGITMMIKESIHSTIIRLYFILVKLSKRH